MRNGTAKFDLIRIWNTVDDKMLARVRAGHYGEIADDLSTVH